MAEFVLQSIGETLQKRLEGLEPSFRVYTYGTVRSFSDGVAQVDGLEGCRYGELIRFEGGVFGLALELRLGSAGVVLLGSGTQVLPGSVARGTGRVADVPVGEALLGRVVDPIGRPLDARELRCSEYRPLEMPAPSLIQRSPVKKPLETGVLSVDSMIPIGRGQRELIIGDRQTGKTSLAMSAILRQKGGDVLCVYCAVGQKAAAVSQITRTLEKAGMLSSTVVVAAFASDCAALQYLAPYAACSIAEKFMWEGRDVLVVYDDLSKHAVAYRTMSLLLRRPSGREAYPGDVFYLHSRLLERASSLSDELGGGSMTALPIVETKAGDISAYIPTNVISITDGQVYLESELFAAGVRPAVNVGLSVSRVGRAAQSKAMKAVSASLRLQVAQYRDMAVFAQFGADIDSATAAALRRGERLTELLKQPVDEILSLSEEVGILMAASRGVFANCPLREVAAAKGALLAHLHREAGAAMRRIEQAGDLLPEDEQAMGAALDAFATRWEGERHAGHA